jgi:hypothetical protein
MLSISDLAWTAASVFCVALVVQMVRSRRRVRQITDSHRAAVNNLSTDIQSLRSEIAAKQDAVDRAVLVQKANSEAINKLQETEWHLRRDLESQGRILDAKNDEIAAKAALISQLERSFAEEQGKVAALSAERSRPKIASRKSVFDVPYSDALEIGPLLSSSLPYLREVAAYRLSCCTPSDTVIYALHEGAGKKEVVTYAVTRQSEPLPRGAQRWVIAGDSEQKHFADLHSEATLFVSKLRLATGDLEHLKMTDCVDLARDFSHLLATGGLSILRVLSSMNTSLKLDKIERKIDQIIRMLNAEQIGRFNGIFLAASEEFRLDIIDQVSAKRLRQDLLRLECELLAELRSILASAPDPTAFQLIWGQLTRAGREEFFNKHFLGAIGKVRLALAAFIVDLILVQELDGRDSFFVATIRQQATELRKITKVIGSQLAVIKDRDRVEDVTALHSVCEQFARLLEQLAAQPESAPLGATA